MLFSYLRSAIQFNERFRKYGTLGISPVKEWDLGITHYTSRLCMNIPVNLNVLLDMVSGWPTESVQPIDDTWCKVNVGLWGEETEELLEAYYLKTLWRETSSFLKR